MSKIGNCYIKTNGNIVSQDAAALGGSYVNRDPDDVLRQNAKVLLESCFEPTVIHRANLKPRPGIPLSKENQTDGQIVSPNSSPKNRGNDLSSDKDSNGRLEDSTGITSAESQSSSKAMGTSQQASANINLHSRGTMENDMSTASLSVTDETIPAHEIQYFTPSESRFCPSLLSTDDKTSHCHRRERCCGQDILRNLLQPDDIQSSDTPITTTSRP